MLYVPPDPSLRLWDTWLFRQDDLFHLFHLQRGRAERGCSSIGHAITRDWLHWETLPAIQIQGSGAAWDSGPLMTGMVVAHDDRYYLFYGSMVDRVQRIGVAVSEDLVTWEKVGREPVLEAAGPWYETEPSAAVNYETAWRDPFVFYHAPDACFYAFICARAAGAGDTGGGCIAVARSRDLLTWSLLPPAHVSDVHTCLEVPEYFALNQQHYLTYTTSFHFGTPYPVREAYQATGTFYLVSGEMLSGYHEPEHANALTASVPTQIASYVGRSIPDPRSAGERLYYYHHVFPAAPGEPLGGSFGAPKRLIAANGRLTLRYMPEVLEAQAEPAHTLDNPLGPETAWALFDTAARDGIVEAVLAAPYAGICFRMAAAPDESLTGLAVWLAPEARDSSVLWVMLADVVFDDGPAGQRPALGIPAALRQAPAGASFGAGIRLRVVYRAAFVDVYVNDTLCLTHTYRPEAMPMGSGAGVFYAGQPKSRPVTHARLSTLPAAAEPKEGAIS